MTRKNEVFVLNQPKHSVVSLVILGDELPLSRALHDNIFALEEISDVVFIFSDTYHPGHKEIDKNKFSSLYRACAWIDSAGNLPETIFKAFRYDKEIFQGHIGYCIMNSWDISEKSLSLENILKATSADVFKPILEIRRLGPEELYPIYKPLVLPQPGLLVSLFYGPQDSPEYPTGTENMYSTYTSDSRIIFLKSRVIGTLLGFYHGEGKDVVESFTNPDCRYMVASLLKYLGIDNINGNIEDLNLGTV